MAIPNETVIVVRDEEGAVPVRLVPGADCAVALVWPGMGARFRSLHRVSLQPGVASLVLQHESDAVYYVVEGVAQLADPDTDEVLTCDAGSAVHIDAGTHYQFQAQSASATIVGGACPADLRLYEEDGRRETRSALPVARQRKVSAGIKRVHRDEVQPSVPLISADARLLIWPGTGARYANMNWVRLEPGESNVPHRHTESEDTIYIVSGEGTVENYDRDEIHQFRAGDAVYVAPGIRHAVRADRGVPVISVGGPTPPDWGILRSSDTQMASRPAGADVRRRSDEF